MVSENLIREALHPYPDDLVIATKGGLHPPGPGRVAAWSAGPSTCASSVEMSLRRLGVERIDLYQLHRIDPNVPLADQIGALAELQQAGQDPPHRPLRGDGGADSRRRARSPPIVSVQNLYNLTNRDGEAVLELLRGQRHRVHPVVPDRHRRARPPRRAARRRSPGRTAPRRPSSRSPGCCAARR